MCVGKIRSFDEDHSKELCRLDGRRFDEEGKDDGRWVSKVLKILKDCTEMQRPIGLSDEKNSEKENPEKLAFER